MAGINISSGTEEEKKNGGNTGTGSSGENSGGNSGKTPVSDSIMTNTDGGGFIGKNSGIGIGTGGNAGSGTGIVTEEGKNIYIGNGSGSKESTLAELLRGKTNGSSLGTAGTTAAPTAQEQAETSLAEIRNRYAAQLREQYNQSADRLKTERDEALRENWILQQQAEAALPEQMAAAGINGGATETSLAALRAQYQGNRNDIRSGYADNLGDLNIETAQQQAEAQRGYNERWLEYLLSLAEMEAERKYG